MDELMNKYNEKFGECFPLILTKGMGENEIKEIIKVCIENEQPYEVDAKRDY